MTRLKKGGGGGRMLYLCLINNFHMGNSEFPHYLFWDAKHTKATPERRVVYYQLMLSTLCLKIMSFSTALKKAKQTGFLC